MSTFTIRIPAFRPLGQPLAVQKRSRRFCDAVITKISRELNSYNFF